MTVKRKCIAKTLTPMFRVALLSLTLPILASGVAWSQEPSTREEADRQRREQQAKEVKPYEPNGLERARNFAEEKAISSSTARASSQLGSLTTGSGFAYGLGFRDRDLFSNTGALEIGRPGVSSGIGRRKRSQFPRVARQPLGPRDLGEPPRLSAGKLLWPRTRFESRRSIRLRDPHEPFRWPRGRQAVSHLLVGGGIEYLQPRLGSGQNDRFPDVDDAFSPSEAPGLDARADFLRSDAFIEVDYRDREIRRRAAVSDRLLALRRSHPRPVHVQPHRCRPASVRRFSGRTSRDCGAALRLDIRHQHRPDDAVLFHADARRQRHPAWVSRVRFRAPHAILAQGDIRWEIWSGFDAALFYDAGKVANRREDLDFENLESDYGIGFRFNTNSGVILRVDAAFGSRDGKHLYIVFGGVF